MSSVALVHPEETLKVSVLQAITKCSLFQKNMTLAAAPSQVKSSVTLPHFREFVSALEGKEVEITDTSFRELQRSCEEFGFREFAAKLSEFRRSMGFQEAEDADARGRIAVLEEKAEQYDREIVVLRDKFKLLSTHFGRLAGEVFAAVCCRSVCLDSVSAANSALSAAAGRSARSPARFADHFGLSGDLRRVPRKAFCNSVARLAGWFRSTRISPPMRLARKHSDCDFGHGREHLRRLHSGGVGIGRAWESGQQSEDFSFHAEESAQHPGEEICIEGRNEERGNPL
jgi:hypothetical protein